MGIPKLTSFINNFFTGWKDETVGKYLVIDGCSLCYYLYTFDWINGGQYTDFYSTIAEFFKALESSAVESIVVIDGYDYPEEKSDTVHQRCDDKAREVCNQFTDGTVTSPKVLVQSSQRKTDVLPLLAPNVFQEALCELNVTCIMVDGEADDDIVKLANFYGCPVLSNDSDFYIYPLKGGFIHLNMFDWRTQPLTAKVYHMDAFLEQFKLTHESLRFIIPAMFGNDFLPAVDGQFRGYVHHIRHVTIREMGRRHPFESVVMYASHYDDIKDFVARTKSGCTDYLSKAGKDCLIENCMKAERQYDIQDVHSLDDLHPNTRLHLANKQPLPGWLLQQIRACKYPVDLLMTICAGGCDLPVPMGDPSKKNALHVSRSLRRAIYSLLELHPFVREGMFDKFETIVVAVLTRTIICEGEVITRDMLPDLDLKKRKKMIYFFLHSNADLIELLEEKWRLAIASVVYWNRVATIPLFVIKILILTFVLCSRSIAVPNDPIKIYQNVKIRRTFLKSPTWWEGLDCFTRWQSSYRDASHLSLILQLPLQIYSAGHIFNSEMAMYFLCTNDISLVVSKLPTIDRQLYDQLLTTVLSHKSELNKSNAIRLSTAVEKFNAKSRLSHVIV